MIGRMLLSILMLLGIVASAPASDPLERVEEDQTNGQLSSHDIFNRNIVIDSMRGYTHVSSYRSGAFGFYAHDGNEKTAWVIGPEQKEGFLEISWGLSVPITQVNVFEKDNENVKTLKLELYNGQRWDTISPNDTLTRNRFNFSPRPASALRISIETHNKEGGIAEVEVYNTQNSTPLPCYGSADLVTAMKSARAVILFDGSPCAYSRSGRALIKPRMPEACLDDIWTQPVLEYICSALGGETATGAVGRLSVRLNGHSFTLDAGPGSKVVQQIEELARKAQLEYLHLESLVMIGQGVEALNHDEVASELKKLLGCNPYLVSGKSKAKPDAIVRPSMGKEGVTYEWAGFRATAIPDTHTDAWLKYSETRTIRSWAGAPQYMSRFVKPPEKVTTAELFEAYRGQIRANPETNRVVDTQAFLKKSHSDLFSEFSTYNKLGINVINETGPKDWPDTMHDDFVQWAGTYTLTYYLAKHYGVAAHQYGNEPDWYFNKSTDEQIARRLTLVADAIHSAVDDVNRDCKRNLKAIYAAPVLASDPQGRNARIMMRNLYTRYDGSKSPTKLFQLFNRHRYGGRPHQNALEVRQVKQMMLKEAGETLPQVFTELNYSTGRSWRRPATTFLNDTPDVFTSIASIWGWMMQEQGVYGIFVFKFSDPGMWKRDDTGPFSNVITYSMYPEQDPGVEPPAREQISYGTKNFEVCRLFGRGFHDSRPLLKTDLDCSDLQYKSWTTFDEDSERFYIWSVQANEVMSYELEFDLSKLDLPSGALVTAETVSGARHGEMTKVITLPEDRKIRLQQAPQSAMLVTAHKRTLVRQILYPEADAVVVQGDQQAMNFGTKTWLAVRRHPLRNSNRVTFLKFRLPEGADRAERAVLELRGQSNNTHAYDGGFLFRVYAIEDRDWQEQTITATNAPNLYGTVSSLKNIDAHNFPVGHVTCFRTPSKLMVDVTRAVQEARERKRGELSLVLIREVYWPGENTDACEAILSSREAGQELAPKVYLWK